MRAQMEKKKKYSLNLRFKERYLEEETWGKNNNIYKVESEFLGEREHEQRGIKQDKVNGEL